MSLQRKHLKARILTAGIALLGLFLIWKNEAVDSMEGVPNSMEQEQDIHNHPSLPAQQNQQPKKSLPTNQEPAPQSSAIPYFSFQEESQRVQHLAKQWPRSRQALLDLIEQPDRFSGTEVPPHSLGEIQQRQMGALKVLALRELMNNETDLEQLAQDLRRIQQRAQDPTIRRIANAAGQSLSRGRSFFNDFLDGVDRLAL